MQLRITTQNEKLMRKIRKGCKKADQGLSGLSDTAFMNLVLAYGLRSMTKQGHIIIIK